METTIIIAIYIVFFILMFFVWAAIHEYSHVYAVRLCVPNAKTYIKLYPHKKDGKFYWARASWEYPSNVNIPAHDIGSIYFMPRIANLVFYTIAILPATMFGFAHPILGTFLALFALAGCVDLAYGSIGTTPNSDLQRVAKAWRMSPKKLRIFGWFNAILFSIAAIWIIYLIN